MNAEYKRERAPGTKLVTVQERDHSVLLYNCHCHMFELVVLGLEQALGCSGIQASRYAVVAEKFGAVCVFQGTMEACSRIAYELSTMMLEVSVE